MATETKKLFALPGHSANWVSCATLESLGRHVILRFDFHKGIDQRAAIIFDEPIVHRYTYQDGCTAEQVDAAYNKVIEITKSDWLDRALTNIHPRNRTGLDVKHFMVFLSDFGCFEALATNVWLTDVEPAIRVSPV